MSHLAVPDPLTGLYLDSHARLRQPFEKRVNRRVKRRGLFEHCKMCGLRDAHVFTRRELRRQILVVPWRREAVVYTTDRKRRDIDRLELLSNVEAVGGPEVTTSHRLANVSHRCLRLLDGLPIGVVKQPVRLVEPLDCSLELGG